MLVQAVVVYAVTVLPLCMQQHSDASHGDAVSQCTDCSLHSVLHGATVATAAAVYSLLTKPLCVTTTATATAATAATAGVHTNRC
jgi:hypothetical protein